MRDLGDTTAYLRRGIREILCLALFFFTFLAGEYFFDVRVAEFVPANEVVIYESIVVGASVIGYFVRPLLYYRRPQAIDATSDMTGVLLVSALLLLIMAAQFQVGGAVSGCDCGRSGGVLRLGLLRIDRPCQSGAAFCADALFGTCRGGFLCCGHFGTGAQPYGDACGHPSTVCPYRLCDCAGWAASRYPPS